MTSQLTAVAAPEEDGTNHQRPLTPLPARKAGAVNAVPVEGTESPWQGDVLEEDLEDAGLVQPPQEAAGTRYDDISPPPTNFIV